MSKQSRRPAPPRGHGGMYVQLEKPKDFKGTFRRLITYLKPRQFQLLFVFLLAILGTLFSVLGPKVMGDTITVLFEGAYAKFTRVPGGHIDFYKIAKLLLLLAGLYVFSSFFQFLQYYIMASVSQKTVYDLREDVFDKIKTLPLSYFDQHAHGDTLSRVTNDIDTIATTLHQSLMQFITSFVTIIGILMMMLWIIPFLPFISLVSIPLSFFIIRPLLKRSQKN